MGDKARIYEDWLVTNARAGDEMAARLLVESHHRAMMAHALRLTGHREDAEDAVQGAWRDIFATFHRLKEPRAFRAWAYRIVTGKAGRMMRREIADRRRDQNMPEQQASPAPDTIVEHGEIRAAIAQLPPGHRAAIALFYLEGFTIAEVAVALKIPVGTAKTRLMHARLKLREQLEGDDQ